MEFVDQHHKWIKTSEKERDVAKEKLTSLELKELSNIDKDLNDQYLNVSRLLKKQVPPIIQ